MSVNVKSLLVPFKIFKLLHKSPIWAGTQGWRRHCRLQVSQNLSCTPFKRAMVGGTLIGCLDDVVFRISDQGNDERQLGRWSYITFEGKNKLKTTLLTAYCPVISHEPGSVYSQHLLYMSTNKDNLPALTCPRALFWKDLGDCVNSFLEEGHQLIINGDFNSDITKLSEWILSFGLKDLIA